MTANMPPSEHNMSAMDQEIIDAIDAQQADTFLTPEMQERVRGRLMQRIAQDSTPRPCTCASPKQIPV